MSDHSPNKWRRLFFGLLLFNIAVIAVLLILLFWPVKEVPLPNGEQNSELKDSSQFIIRTTRNNLTEMVNAYVDNLAGSDKYHYQVRLDEDVHLIGEYPVFSSTVPLNIHLEPFVEDNGDVILKLRSISAGLLELPNKQIMAYLDEKLPKPDWVTVNPRTEEIYVALSKMEIKSNFRVKAEHIDLAANNIAFKIEVPYEKIGLEKED